MVNIIGADRSFTVWPESDRRRFLFENWWSKNWGIDGHGFLPWEFFTRWLVEAWVMDSVGGAAATKDEAYSTIPGITGGLQHIGEINDSAADERMAWTIVTERQDSLDVEELFVKPQYRRKGFGKKLLISLQNLSRKRELPLRFVIPFSDGVPDNVSLFRKMLDQIGYRIEASSVRWAPFFASAIPAPESAIVFPQRPGLAPPKQELRSETQNNSGRPAGLDSAFENAVEKVFRQHSELLRRLA